MTRGRFVPLPTANREALLVAAEAEFAEHGAEASVADIARRAGVAKGDRVAIVHENRVLRPDTVAVITHGQ